MGTDLRTALLDALAPFANQRVVVAFSGGPDSLALLIALAEARRAAGRARDQSFVAAHFDHGLDQESRNRAQRAEHLAAQLEAVFHSDRARALVRDGTFQGVESWAREQRYRFLKRTAQAFAADHILTAHHLDDQAETVLLRLRFGSGVWGMGAIQPRRETIARPLLDFRRRELAVFLRDTADSTSPFATAATAAIDDPNNRDLRFERNRIRHLTLPRLGQNETRSTGNPETSLPESLARLANRAHSLRLATTNRLPELFEIARAPSSEDLDAHWRFPFSVLERPESPRFTERLRLALHATHELAAAPPPRASALAELTRQLRLGRVAGTPSGIGPSQLRVDIGNGWRWEISRDRHWFSVRRADVSPQPKAPSFAYTFRIPGGLWLPEIDRIIEVERFSRASPPATASDGCFVHLPTGASTRLVVRTRQPGDRRLCVNAVRPKKLKKTLARLPLDTAERDALPLLALDDGRVVGTVGLPGRLRPTSFVRAPASAPPTAPLANATSQDSGTSAFEAWVVRRRRRSPDD